MIFDFFVIAGSSGDESDSSRGIPFNVNQSQISLKHKMMPLSPINEMKYNHHNINKVNKLILSKSVSLWWLNVSYGQWWALAGLHQEK